MSSYSRALVVPLFRYHLKDNNKQTQCSAWPLIFPRDVRSWYRRPLEWDLWAAGICPLLPENLSKAALPQKLEHAEEADWAIMGQTLCRFFFPIYLFFLSDGYNTNGPHFSFSLALLMRNRDIGISLNSLHVCSESQSKHPAKFQERNWRQLWKGRCSCLIYRVSYSLQ